MCTFFVGELIMNLKYMDLAFKEAKKAFQQNEVPIGAILVKNDEIIAKSHNNKEKKQCCLAHAELNVIKKASKKLKNWRLEDCDLYVTLDPCPMCASAIKQARIKNVFSACSNSDKGNFELISTIFMSDSTNNSVNFVNNLAENESKTLLNEFFELKRRKK